jgi:hypothetical protein
LPIIPPDNAHDGRSSTRQHTTALVPDNDDRRYARSVSAAAVCLLHGNNAAREIPPSIGNLRCRSNVNRVLRQGKQQIILLKHVKMRARKPLREICDAMINEDRKLEAREEEWRIR